MITTLAGGGGVSASGVLGGCPIFDIANDDALTLDVNSMTTVGNRYSYMDCPAGALVAAGQSLAWHSTPPCRHGCQRQGQGQGGDNGGLPSSRNGFGGG